MSAALVQAVLAADIKPAHAKLVAFVLAWHARDEDGHAWPSIGTLECECAMSRRHVKRAIGQLLRAGVLTVAQPSKGGPRVATTVYAVTIKQVANPVRGRTRCADAPGAPAPADPVRPRLLPGAPAHHENNERNSPKANSLSLKKRGPVSPAGSRAWGARPSAEPAAPMPTDATPPAPAKKTPTAKPSKPASAEDQKRLKTLIWAVLLYPVNRPPAQIDKAKQAIAERLDGISADAFYEQLRNGEADAASVKRVMDEFQAIKAEVGVK